MQYSIEDLVRLAKRENNTARPYLYVNPKQGKHIPTDPQETLAMCAALANKVNETYPNDALYVIGFAETATGIASGISRFLKNVVFYQNTTREYKEGEKYLYFTESHSHAQDQMLRSAGIEDYVCEIDRILLIDDEVTTGRTICKLIDAIKNNYQVENVKYSIVSVLNSMTPDRIAELEKADIDCIYLTSIPYEYGKEDIIRIPVDNSLHHVTESNMPLNLKEICFECDSNPRGIVSFSEYQMDNMKFAELVINRFKGKHYNRMLVLGTEEFMYPTICVGEALELSGIADQVRIHSTTRSPIVAYDSVNYPLKQRYQLRSFYDVERTTYLYNLEAYDGVLILTDGFNYKQGLSDLCDYLSQLGNKTIFLGRWKYKEA